MTRDARRALVVVLCAVHQQHRHRYSREQRNCYGDDHEADASNDQAHQFQSTYDRRVKSTATTKVTPAADKTAGAESREWGIVEIANENEGFRHLPRCAKAGTDFASCGARRPMEGTNQSSQSPRDEYSNLISNGLVLWRISMDGRSDRLGMVFELPEGLFFVVDDDPEGSLPYTVHEQHPDVISLVDRAEELKQSLCKCGWVEVEEA